MEFSSKLFVNMPLYQLSIRLPSPVTIGTEKNPETFSVPVPVSNGSPYLRLPQMHAQVCDSIPAACRFIAFGRFGLEYGNPGYYINKKRTTTGMRICPLQACDLSGIHIQGCKIEGSFRFAGLKNVLTVRNI